MPGELEIPPGYYVADDGTGAWLTLPWPRKPDGSTDAAALPPSLAPQVIAWCERWLVHHLTGDPWRYTQGQKRFLHMWWAVRADGKWLYRRGVKRGAKGTGKDPLAATMALAELCGPVIFDGWRPDGRPRGKAHRMSLVQIGANSEAQAKDVLRVANAMAGADFRVEYGYDPGVLASQLPSGSRIELLTNSEASAEGDPASAGFLNESHHSRADLESSIAAVLARNCAKSPGGQARLLEFTNSHAPGEGSVAEQSFNAWQLQAAGRTKRVDILYDSREAPAHLRTDSEDDLVAGIAAAYGDSAWTDQETILATALDPGTSTADTVRYYLNSLPTNDRAWVDPRRFDTLARPGTAVADGERIAMFLDCSKSEDATGLVACRLDDGHVFTLSVWQKPRGHRGRWLAPRTEVDAAVLEAAERYDVTWFGVDPSPAREDETEALYWQAYIDRWHIHFRDLVTLWATPGVGGSSVLFDMRTSQPGGRERVRAFVRAAERTAIDIDGLPELDDDVQIGVELAEPDELTHDGHATLRIHAHNARRLVTPWGVSLGKRTRDSTDLVDLAVCMVGARMGRRLVLASGKLKATTERSNVAVFI